MGLSNGGKLNRLMNALPEGVVAPSMWLKSQGISPQLARKYVMNGWLRKEAHGCYALPGSPVIWEGVLLGLSRLGGLRLHVGGKSALSRSGDVHYLELGGESKVEVWSNSKPPSWVTEVQLNSSLDFKHGNIFSASANETGLAELKTGVRDWTLKMSYPERAILEFLSGLGNSKEDFQYASEMVEGLTLARPALVQQLLEACTSVRVKRLFLFLATFHQLRWLKKIDLSKVDTGSGKRQIVKGGRLDSQFQITVPESFVG